MGEVYEARDARLNQTVAISYDVRTTQELPCDKDRQTTKIYRHGLNQSCRSVRSPLEKPWRVVRVGGLRIEYSSNFDVYEISSSVRTINWADDVGMRIKIGEVEALFRYPVKSMSGELLEVADLGWHGLDGDRRLAFRRADDRGGFPWLTASKLPELILFAPQRRGAAVGGNLPTHVRTPEGEELTVFGEELARDVGRRHGSPVEMTHLNRGIFDEASISVITSATVGEIGRLAAQRPDVRRFRPNILISSPRSVPFEEDEWVGGVLSFGETSEAATIGITNRDERCSMVNLDPGSARLTAEVLKTIVRVRDNKAGVYGTVTRRGHLAVGQPIFFEPATEHRERL